MEEPRAETTTLIETSEEKRSRECQNPPLPKVARFPHGSMRYLPSNISLDILSRVPTETILDCKLVCKRWENLLQYGGSHNFNDMHVKRQLQYIYASDSISQDWVKVDIGLLFVTNYLGGNASLFYGREHNDKIHFDFFGSPSMLFGRTRDYGLIGSCNGLICSGKYQYHKDHDIIRICNPITGEYANISGFIKCEKGLYISQVVRGFGYVRTTNEYKVVRIYYLGDEDEDEDEDDDEDEDYMGRVQVYTLGSGCGWRNKQTSCPRLNDRMVGTCANGAIHWISDGSIHAFDLANEEFRTVSSPPCDTNYMLGYSGLVVLAGNLCFHHQGMHARNMDIWSLKKTDKNESWCRDFSIAYEIPEGQSYAYRLLLCLRPILLTKNNKVIFTSADARIHCYDPETRSWQIILDKDGCQVVNSVTAIPHVNTFVSLASLGEKSYRKRGEENKTM